MSRGKTFHFYVIPAIYVTRHARAQIASYSLPFDL